MKLIFGLLILAGLPLLVMQLIGRRMPREHKASRTARVRGSAAAIFAAITQVEAFPQWRPSVKSVDALADLNGKRRYRETTSRGALTFEVTETVQDARLVTTIVDEGQPFGGRWTFDLHSQELDTDVTITEDGFVNPPIFRFLSRYAFGHTATIDTYLKNLEQRFAQVKG